MVNGVKSAFASSLFIESMDKHYKSAKLEAESRIKDYFATNQQLHSKHPMLQHKHVKKELERCMLSVHGGEYVLISFDIEAWERNTENVLEIGMSIYDPRNQQGCLMPTFKNIHIMVEEYTKCSNGRFVPDRHAQFMAVDTIVMNLENIRYFIQGIIEYYHELPSLNIGLVGHSIGGDLDWLKKLGIEMPPASIIDTHTIFQYSRMKNQLTNLSSALLKVDTPHGYLHNAGNDAYFTLILAFKLLDPKIRSLHQLDVWKPDEIWDTRSKRQRENEKANIIPISNPEKAVKLYMNSVFGDKLNGSKDGESSKRAR